MTLISTLFQRLLLPFIDAIKVINGGITDGLKLDGEHRDQRETLSTYVDALRKGDAEINPMLEY